jgi:hypothetical protein
MLLRSTLTKQYIYISWFVNLTWTREEDLPFSPQIVLAAALRILNTCVLDFHVISVVCSVRGHVFFFFIGPGFLVQNGSEFLIS